MEWGLEVKEQTFSPDQRLSPSTGVVFLSVSFNSRRADRFLMKLVLSPIMRVYDCMVTCLNEGVLGAPMNLLGNLKVTRKRPLLQLVICGGSALIALKLVARTTQAVDVVAIVEGGQLRCASSALIANRCACGAGRALRKLAQ